NNLPVAVFGVPYSFSLTATGGVPVYNWDISSGALPPGLTLDAFTGLLSGTPSAAGAYAFTVRVRDYHEGGAGVTRSLSLNVVSGQPALNVSINGQGPSSQAQLLLYGTNGQRQIIEASTNLWSWTPITT